MRPAEIHSIASALDSTVVSTRTLAGGFSHDTHLVTLAEGQVVARFGGPDPGIEAAVMALASQYVPVPRVLAVIPTRDGARPGMILEFVTGTPLSDVLGGEYSEADLAALGAEVGRVVASISEATFDRPGFFVDKHLTVGSDLPWSKQLPEFAATCMGSTLRLDEATRQAWVELCTAHAPALERINHHARLVHADINPKNILVTRTAGGWRVDAVLDWEFSYSGCPYGDVANMARFGDDYPAGFLGGFNLAFAEHQPVGLPLADDWVQLGRVLDMFALSDLTTRPGEHLIADRAADQIRLWIAQERKAAGGPAAFR
jgi:aminoglycoside phosphotransferase (APT) family kinase protein